MTTGSVVQQVVVQSATVALQLPSWTSDMEPRRGKRALMSISARFMIYFCSIYALFLLPSMTQTAAPSAVASLYYDWRSFRAQRFAVKATPIGPGRVELKGVNRNASVMGATRWTFSEFELGTGAFVNPKPAAKGQPPNFVLATVCTNCGSFDAYDDSPVTVAFATPGVYYWGVIGEAGGNQGLASGGGSERVRVAHARAPTVHRGTSRGPGRRAGTALVRSGVYGNYCEIGHY
jgi:hypothetical protein